MLRQFVMPDDDTVDIPHSTSFWVLLKLTHYMEDKFLCQMMIDRGDVESWPIEFLHPHKKNVRVNPAFHRQLCSFFDDLFGSDIHFVSPRINKYGRCLVNGMKFSSHFNSSDRGSVVKAMFVDENNQLFPFFGVVRFYFTVTTVIQQQPKTHQLAYVTWLKFKSQTPDSSKLYTVTREEYRHDRIISPRRFLGKCVLVAPKVNASHYLVSELS